MEYASQSFTSSYYFRTYVVVMYRVELYIEVVD